MNTKMLKYEFTIDEVNYLLAIVNRTQIVGIQGAKELIFITDKLQKPLNSNELEKDQYEQLKGKFEKKEKI